MGLSKASRLTTLRLFHDYFIGEITTIGYDYFRSCYDYSSRDATTIARPYWLSGESPKRDTAVAVNGSAPLRRALATGLLRRACLVCDALHRLAWIRNGGAPLHPYIHYYNRRSALSCTASGVVLVSGTCWRCCGAVIRSSVAQAVL